jgi:hypothetical protein
MLSLTIHEALPGHLLQGEYANRVTPEWRRVLRVVGGNGAYVEGWAVYAEHVMEQLGVTGGDPVQARLTALKAMLRVYSNVVIDARLHTAGMPADSVVPFLMRDTLQEEPEATAARLYLDRVGAHGEHTSIAVFWGVALGQGEPPAPVRFRHCAAVRTTRNPMCDAPVSGAPVPRALTR